MSLILDPVIVNQYARRPIPTSLAIALGVLLFAVAFLLVGLVVAMWKDRL